MTPEQQVTMHIFAEGGSIAIMDDSLRIEFRIPVDGKLRRDEFATKAKQVDHAIKKFLAAAGYKVGHTYVEGADEVYETVGGREKLIAIGVSKCIKIEGGDAEYAKLQTLLPEVIKAKGVVTRHTSSIPAASSQGLAKPRPGVS